jgi:hypothetical protein
MIDVGNRVALAFFALGFAIICVGVGLLLEHHFRRNPAREEWVRLHQQHTSVGELGDIIGSDPNINVGAVLTDLEAAELDPATLHDVTLPDHFAFHPDELSPVMNQGACESCWAVVAQYVVSDRENLYTRHTATHLSTQQLVACSGAAGGYCRPGRLTAAWEYMTTHGLVAESARPYRGGELAAPAAACPLPEAAGAGEVRVAPGSIVRLPANRPEVMRRVIYTTGPVAATVRVTAAFQKYVCGTVLDAAAAAADPAFVGLHNIEVVGWGATSAGRQYWVCRTSWGNDWPAYCSTHPDAVELPKSYFLLSRGEDVLGVESLGVFAAVPVTRDKHSDVTRREWYREATDADTVRLALGWALFGAGAVMFTVTLPMWMKR